MTSASLSDNVLFRKYEAEKQLAIVAQVHPDLVLNQCGWIPDEMFSDERLRKFWHEFRATHDPVASAIAVSYDFLAGLSVDSGNYYFTRDAGIYGNKLAQENYLYRIAAERLGEITKAIAEGDAQQVQRIIDEVAAQPPNVVRSIPDASDLAIDFLASLDEEYTGVPAFVERFDLAYGGYWNGNLYIVAARPGVGKTAWIMQCARNAARNGRKVLVASIEMTSRDLWERMACGAARVNIRDLKSKRVTPEQRDLVIAKANNLMDIYHERLYIDARPVQTTDQLWQKVATMKPDIVFTDHLRLFSDYHKGEREDQRLGRISWAHKQIAKEFNIPVIAAAQLNRDAKARQDKRPTLTDLRDSGQIEENADVVIGLHREDQYIENKVVRSPAEFVCLKFRNGPDSLINLEFDGLAQWFLAPGERIDDA